MFGNKVFSRKGKFLARDVDPPIGDFVATPVSKPSPKPIVVEPDTRFYEGCNVRVRVLKPDAEFLRDVTQRLARLDISVRQLNEKKHTEN